MAIEAAALKDLHLYDLKESCQLEWACRQLKPKVTSQRLDRLLLNIVHNKIDSKQLSLEDVHCILQGHRANSKDLYIKMRQIILENKN